MYEIILGTAALVAMAIMIFVALHTPAKTAEQTVEEFHGQATGGVYWEERR